MSVMAPRSSDSRSMKASSSRLRTSKPAAGGAAEVSVTRGTPYDPGHRVAPPVTTAAGSRTSARGAAGTLDGGPPRLQEHTLPGTEAHRLPTTVAPSRYDLTIEPDLDAATFTGTES